MEIGRRRVAGGADSSQSTASKCPSKPRLCVHQKLSLQAVLLERSLTNATAAAEGPPDGLHLKDGHSFSTDHYQLKSASAEPAPAVYPASSSSSSSSCCQRQSQAETSLDAFGQLQAAPVHFRTCVAVLERWQSGCTEPLQCHIVASESL